MISCVTACCQDSPCPPGQLPWPGSGCQLADSRVTAQCELELTADGVQCAGLGLRNVPGAYRHKVTFHITDNK